MFLNISIYVCDTYVYTYTYLIHTYIYICIYIYIYIHICPPDQCGYVDALLVALLEAASF